MPNIQKQLMEMQRTLCADSMESCAAQIRDWYHAGQLTDQELVDAIELLARIPNLTSIAVLESILFRSQEHPKERVYEAMEALIRIYQRRVSLLDTSLFSEGSRGSRLDRIIASALDPLFHLLQDEEADPDLREYAFNLIIKHVPPWQDAITAVEFALSSSPPDVTARMLRTLAQNRTHLRYHTRAVLSFMHHPDPLVRCSAVTAAQYLDVPISITQLVWRSIVDSDDAVRSRAAESLLGSDAWHGWFRCVDLHGQLDDRYRTALLQVVRSAESVIQRLRGKEVGYVPNR